MGTSDTLQDLLSSNTAWVLDRALGYAKEHGYTKYAATQLKAWEIAISGISDSIVGTLDDYGTIPAFGVDDFAHDTPVVAFGRQEVTRHRARGVTYPMFMGLVKYFRQSFMDLVRREGLDARTEGDYLALLQRYFDLFEIGCGVEFNAIDNSERVEELQTLNRLMVNEKNKFYTIFESLYDPVILVDMELCIEGMNDSALDHFYDRSQRDTFAYFRPPLAEVVPWLADEVARFAATDEHEVVFERSTDTPLGERTYEVKMKPMQDATDKHHGTVLILNDLTERKRKEEALVLNEAIERWVNTLVGIGHLMSTMDDVEGVLPLVVASARELLEARYAALAVWDKEKQQFEVRYVSGLQLDGWTGATLYYDLPEDHRTDCSHSERGWLDEMACSLYRDLHPGLRPNSAASCLSEPLIMEGETVGALLVGRHEPFTESAAVVLASLANQAVIAVEHALMAQRMRSVAVLDERTRIAREMHDGLAQILGFLNLEMQSLELLAKQGREDEIVSELRRARERILEAHADVRENILSLRTALSGDAGPITALRNYLREFGAQSGITTHLTSQVGDDAPLTSMAQVQLVRIVQGALVNVRRHAYAEHARVTFSKSGQELEVLVEDDGVGFEPDSVDSDIGLQSMKERAESVGGRMEIDSAPGEGTRVRIRVPLGDSSREFPLADAPGTSQSIDVGIKETPSA